MPRRTPWIAGAFVLAAAAALGTFALTGDPDRHTAPPPTGASGLNETDASSPGSRGTDPCVDFHRAVCRRRGEIRDPTGYVRRDIQGEVSTLRIFEEIVLLHPDWDREKVYEELTRRVYTPARRKRLGGAYRWVRASAERFIRRQAASVFSKAEQKTLIGRIRKVKLDLPDPKSAYDDEPDLLTKNGVYYERLSDGSLRLRVGGAYLSSATSWFNLIFTVAHEFGHAIDPCEIRAAGLSMPAYDRLSACLVRTGLVALRRDRAECGENDQLSETFADWLAVSIVSDALRRFATEFDRRQVLNSATNAVRDLCEQDESITELDLTYHPSPEVRIERIFGQHPGIRKVLGCGQPSNAQAYCGFDSQGGNGR